MLHIHVGNRFDLLLGHRRIQRGGDMGLARKQNKQQNKKQAQKGKKRENEFRFLYLLCFPRLQLTITPNLTTPHPPFFWIHACSYKMSTLEVLDKSWFYTRNGDWLHSKRDTMPSNDQQECINVNTHTSLKSLFAI